MKALQDLIYLVTRHKRKQLNVLGYDEDGESRYELFYDRLERGLFQSDNEASAFFFGKNKGGKFIQYVNFKNQFFKRLVNTVFHLDLKQSAFNEAQRGFYNCWKNLAAIKIMSAKGANTAAFKLMKGTLSAAIKFGVTEVTLEIARLLLFHYTVREPDTRKQAYFKKMIAEQQEELALIIQAETMHRDLIAPFVLSRSSKPHLGERARQYLLELAPHVGKVKGYRFYLYYFLIKRLEREIVFDYEGVVAVSEEALRHFEHQCSTPKTTITIFCNTLLVGLTMLKDYERAEQIAQKSMNMVDRYAAGWYKTAELYIALKFHQKAYQSAYSIYCSATRHKRFEYLSDGEKESWKIYEAYLQLLIVTGKVVPAAGEGKMGVFRPGRFLNEVPHFSKDKRGMNIPILITHAVYLLYQKKYEASYDRMLALGKYNTRHLTEGDDTFRSWCFLQALLNVQKADFNRALAEERSAVILDRMRSQPIQLLNAPHEVEVMPYEHMWELAMEAIG